MQKILQSLWKISERPREWWSNQEISKNRNLLQQLDNKAKGKSKCNQNKNPGVRAPETNLEPSQASTKGPGTMDTKKEGEEYHSFTFLSSDILTRLTKEP